MTVMGQMLDISMYVFARLQRSRKKPIYPSVRFLTIFLTMFQRKPKGTFDYRY